MEKRAREEEPNGGAELKLPTKKQNTGAKGIKGKTLFEIFSSNGIEEEDAKKYEKIFQTHRIDTEMLSELSYYILHNLGIEVIGHQMKIMKLVRANFAPVMPSFMGEGGFPMLAQGGSRQGPISTQEIRRRVRAAFIEEKRGSGKKQKRAGGFFGDTGNDTTRYYIETSLIRDEVRKSKEALMIEGDTMGALTILEAVTDEFVNFETEVGENNITGYDDYLTELVKDWVALFLSRDCTLEKTGRDVWETKLGIWDKSADKEHGTFVDARWAAKHGWDDTLLQNVLEGDHIGKFYEPTGLVAARLNMLETESDFQAGLNLSKAMDMFSWTARFLLKLGKVDEAEAIAYKIKEPAAAFSIAQVSRPLNVKVAFNIAVYTISLSEDWSIELLERASWVCELAISEKMLDELVQEIVKSVKVKPIQFEICKVLHKQEQLMTAVNLAKICLKPYPEDELMKLQEEKNKRNMVTQIQQQQQQVVPAILTIDQGFLVPRNLAKWLWETVFEMEVIKAIPKDKLIETLDLILTLVVDVQQLVDITSHMSSRQEYGLIFKVGQRSIDLLDKQSKESLAKKEEYIERAHQINLLVEEQQQLFLKKQQLPQEKLTLLTDLQLKHQSAAVTPYYDAAQDTLKLQVCKVMIKAALDSKTCILPEKVLSEAEIDNVFNLCLKSIEDLNHLISFATELHQRSQFRYAEEVSQKTILLIQDFVKLAEEREAVSQQLSLLQTEQHELQQQRKPMPVDHLQTLQEVTLHTNKFTLLPGYKTMSSSSFKQLVIQAAQLMVTSALEIKKVKLQELLDGAKLDENSIEEELWRIVSWCLNYVKIPSDMMQLGQVLHQRGSHNAVLRLVKCTHSVLDNMFKTFIGRQTPVLHLKILEQEQEYFLAMKKQLEPEQQKLKEQLEQQIQDLPRQTVWDTLPTNSAQFEQLAFSAAELMLSAVSDSKRITEDKIAKDLTMTEEQIKKERDQHTQEIAEVMDYCLNVVKSPSLATKLIQRMTSGPLAEYVTVITVSEKVLKGVEDLRSKRNAREPMLAQLDALWKKRDELSLTKKYLEPADASTLREMELKNRIERQGPACYFMPNSDLDNELLAVSQLTIKSLLDWEDSLESKVEEEQLLLEKTLSKERIDAERKKIRAFIEKGVSLCLDYLQDAVHQFKVEKSVSERARKQVNIVFKFGEKCHETIRDINTKRVVRAPIQQQLDTVTNEIEILEKSKKPVPPELSAQATDLLKKLDQLPAWPHFSDLLNFHEYDTLNFKIVSTMIAAALDAKQILETKIKQMADSIDDSIPKWTPEETEVERAKIKKQIDGIVSLCLSNVHDPSHLVKFQEEVRARKESAVVIDVGKACLNEIKQLNDQREIRAPLQTEFLTIKKEEEELALKKKQLEPEQQQRLKDLEAKMKKLPEWPHYAQLFDFNQYDASTLTAVKAMVSSVLDRKQEFEAKVAKMEAEADASMDVKQIAAERAEIQTQLDFVVDFSLTNLMNPLHLLPIAQRLATSEMEKVFEVSEKCQEKILEIESLQRKRYPLQIQLDQLKAEQQQLLAVKKQLTPEQEEQIKSVEKQLSALPTWPRWSSLGNLSQYNSTIYGCAWNMVSVVLKAYAALEARVKQLVEDGHFEINEEDIAKERKALDAQMGHVIKVNLAALKNPHHLSTLAIDLNKHQDQGDTAIKVGEQVYIRVKEIEDHKEIRIPLETRLAEINAEEFNLVQVKKQLTPEMQKERDSIKKQLSDLPDWPFYSTLTTREEFSGLALEIAKLQLRIVLNKEDDLEARVKQQQEEEPEKMDMEAIANERKALKNQLDHVCKLCLTHIENPANLLALINLLKSKKRSPRVIQFAIRAYERQKFVEEQRVRRDSLDIQITLLTQEKLQLEQEKKVLRPAQEKKLDKLVEERKHFMVKPYVSNADKHDGLNLDIANEVLLSVWDKKKLYEQRISFDVEGPRLLTEQEIKDMRAEVQGEVDSAVKMFAALENPRHLVNLAKVLLSNHKEQDIVVRLGHIAQEKLNKLEKMSEAAVAPRNQMEALREEKATLEQSRKQLSEDKHDQLRQLELDDQLLYRMPNYVICDAGTYDDLKYQVAKLLIDIVLEQQNEFENKVAMQDDLPEAKVKEEREKMKAQLEEIVNGCLKTLHKVKNLYSLTKIMNERKEFPLVIKVGLRCEERIEELNQNLEEREDLEKSQRDINEQVTLQKEGATKKQQKELDEIAEKLGKLPVPKETKVELSDWLLTVAGFIIGAAKIEDNDEVLRKQTTMAFKADPTADRWDHVRNLTSDEDWEEVRKEMVVYLLKASTDPSEKSFIDPTVKMALLLKEGLWKECVEIFPPPTGKGKEIEILNNMWLEVEKNSPHDLLNIIPTVESYLKSWYQGWKYLEFEKIMDQVERRCPDQLTDLYKAGAEVMMVNMIPSKYSVFVAFIKAFKLRVVNAGRKKDWEKFYDEFKRVHKGKKKLMNMISMISSSFST